MTRNIDSARRLRAEDKRALLAALLRDKARQAKTEAPLSHGQKALWFLHQSQPDSPAYNTAFAIRIDSPVEPSALQRSLEALVDRHAALRSSFVPRDGEPVCIIQGTCSITLEQRDARGLDEAALRHAVEQDYRRPFDLAQGPLMRATLFTAGDDSHVLLLALHHIICDAWSLWMLVYELGVLYPLALAGQPLAPPAVGMQYPEFVRWQNALLDQPEGERLWQYWRERLAGELPLLDLPCDRPRPPLRSVKGASHFFALEGELVGELEEVGKRHGATLFMVLLAAFQVLLHRYCNQDDLIVASPAAGRNHPDVAATVGYFANPLPLRADFSGEPTFREFLSQVRHTVLDALTHQDMPFPLLIERLKPKRDPSRSPLAETMFVLQRPPKSEQFAGVSARQAGGRMNWGGLDMAPYPIAQMEGQFDLVWEAVEDGRDSLPCVLKYNAALFDPTTIQRMEGHLRTLLWAITRDTEQAVGKMPLLTEPERRQVLIEWNATRKDYPLDRCLHHWIEDAARRSPEALAVEMADGGGALSYRELNARANQLARHLKKRGVGPECLVGICTERSLEMVVGLLGILKAGAAYLPLDPEYPPQRLAFMLTDSKVRVLLTHAPAESRLPPTEAAIIRLDADWPLIEREDGGDFDSGAGPDSLAYVIYTSGSTGQPKGAGNHHRGICNRLLWMQDEFRLDPTDRALQKTPFSFDVSVWEFFWPLLAGARLVLARPGGHRDREYLVETILGRRITTVHFVPSMLSVFLDATRVSECRSTLRRVICSGEALTVELQRRFFERLDVPLHNLYGPTEAAVDVTHWRCRPDATARTVPIGRPIANLRIYLLDRHGAPVPVGVPGELYIGGVGVGRGYLNRPELTVERFVADPFSDEPGAKLYRTGDLCRWLADGTIEYLHRIDSQVKIRGFRIELGEIESALAEHPQVREAAARADRDATGGRLLAWFVPEPGERPNAVDLRAFLRDRLPDYMLPAALIPLDMLPLSPNGKIDRAALPVPTSLHSGLGEAASPRTDIERRVLAIWQEVLGLDKVGVHDNFFDLGGHSLLLAKVKARLDDTFARSPTMVELFQHTTVHALARFIAGEETAPAKPVPARAGGSADIAVIGMAGRFPGSPDIDAFWENLCAGREGIRFFDDAELRAAGVDPDSLNDPNYVKAFGWLDGIDQIDAGFFGYTPREAELIDVQQRLLLECAFEALESSGHDPQTEDRRYGVFVGVGMNRYLLYNLMSNRDLLAAAGGYSLMLASDKDFAPTRLSYKLNLKGPSLNVQTACSTSLVAIHLACRSLLAGECDTALAGGCSVTLPQDRGYLYQPDMILSPDGHCRAFDKDAQGTVGGNGVGIVVLKRLEDALADGDFIYAIVKGSAINNDGADKAGYTAPSVAGQAAVIRAALAAAGVSPDSIGYVETHGTGTVLGDPIELTALGQAFQGASRCAIGSVKTNIGHLDSAAGVAGFIKTALALRHRAIPPSLHFREANSQLKLEETPFRVQTTLEVWETDGQPRRAGVSSFGIGGTNAHMILEEPPAPVERHGRTRPVQLLPISARDQAALDAATARLADALRRQPELDLADVAFTLAVGRRAFDRRRMLVCSTPEEAVRLLDHGESLPSDEAEGCEIAFLFTGQGAQAVGMAADLYRNEAEFREWFDRCADILAGTRRMDLRRIVYPAPEETEAAASRLRQTAIAQPALFAVEYSLAQFWMSLGIRPQAMLGHSLGEYVAACLAGVFSLEDALELVAWRGEIMQAQPGGAMLAVLLSEAEASALLDADLSLAAVNGPRQCVIAGPQEAIARLASRLEAQGIEGRCLETSHAFHSAMMQPAADALRIKLRSVDLRPPAIPYLSNLTGTWIEAAQATDPDYWARHLRETVRFADGVEALLREPKRLLLEVGPGNTLARLVASHPCRDPGQTALASLPSSVNSSWLETAGRLWLAGAPLDWSAFYAGQARRRVPLPTYPWQRQRYWIEPQAPAARDTQAPERKNPEQWFYLPSWQRTAPPTGRPEANSRWLLLADDGDIAEQLVQHLTRFDALVSIARRGDAFGQDAPGVYTLNPTRREDYDALLHDLSASGRLPQVIVHCWNLGDAAPGRSRIASFHSLVFIAQALGDLDDAEPRRLAVVSDRLHDVTGGEALEPAKALLLGPLTVIPQEYAKLSCLGIDLDPVQPQIEWLAIDAWAASTDAPIIAYRGSHRWTQGYMPADLPVVPPPLRKGGVYLITGGMGGVGMALAEWLARSASGIKLALIGRNLPSDSSSQSALVDLDAEIPRLIGLEAVLKAGWPNRPKDDLQARQQGLDRLCALHIAEYSRQRGIALVEGETYRREELKQRLNLLPKFERFLDFFLDVLIEEGWLRDAQGRLAVVRTPPSGAEAASADLIARFPELSGLCALLKHCASHYSAALSGEIEALGVLFPDGELDLLGADQAYLEESGQRARYLALFGEIVGRLARRAEGRKLRVLEVGGGSGALTQALLRGLDGIAVDYCFTDIGLAQVRAAERKAAELGFSGLRFQVLDISRDPLAQGFAPGGYDLVVGFDVVHATPRIADSLRNLRHLLAPDGVLALLETVKAQRYTDMVWGLTDGWWGFEDGDLRQRSPLLSIPQWVSVLQQVGFARVHALPAEGDRNDAEFGLLLAQGSAADARVPSGFHHLRALGAEVLALQADVSDAVQMREAIARIGQRFGNIHGVIHAAGIAGGGTIQAKTFENSEREFAAKVDGTRVLESLLADAPLDFWVMCSSYVSAVGGFGQAAYAAACAFQDHWAEARARENAACRFLSIAWERWRGLGLAVEVERRHRELTGEALDGGMLAEEGCQAFARILASAPAARVVVSMRDFPVLLKHSRAYQLGRFEAPRKPQGTHARPQLNSGYIAPADETQRLLAEIWQEELGIAAVGVSDDFFALGGDSLLAIKLAARIRQALKVPITVRSLYDAPTIAALAAYVDSLRWAAAVPPASDADQEEGIL